MEYYRIACVSRPHGIHGALKLMPLTDDVRRFQGMQEAYLEQGGIRRPVSISHVSVQPDAVYLSIGGIDTREAADALREAYLCVDKAHRIKLPEGRYFIADLVGCVVKDTDGREYGTLTEVFETGANDVYVVRGAINAMVPALKRVLHTVDVENKLIILDKAVAEEVVLIED